MVYCKRRAPPHLHATVQSVFSALYGGVGAGLGGLLGECCWGSLAALLLQLTSGSA